ncbi:hypothetical protein [Thalassobellus suaedae]|uniref:Uncharacterized protein n=1 Tax=Thalassobellus suaedae TaxID=3074124 RepID=A0ABY9XQA1_9FLAO|nr:hypothetical protein RHP51_13055 [Flavobacteriaceae bacterium HL-DH14]
MLANNSALTLSPCGPLILKLHVSSVPGCNLSLKVVVSISKSVLEYGTEIFKLADSKLLKAAKLYCIEKPPTSSFVIGMLIVFLLLFK